MNLAKIRELEDLKGKLSVLQQQANKNFEQSKFDFFSKGVQEFKDFFIHQGFDIQENNRIDGNGHNNKVIVANYNDFKVDIAIPPKDISYIGAISVWELNVYKNKTKYSLMINEYGEERHTSIFSSVSTRELTENEKIEKEIEEIGKRIIKLRKELESNKQVILSIELVEEEEKKNRYNHYEKPDLQFKSMTELLNHLFS